MSKSQGLIKSLRALSPAPLAVLLTLALGATPALAARGHVFSHAFGAGILEEPAGIAVNETAGNGDIYVADTKKDKVLVFNADGSKLEGELSGPNVTGTGTLEAGSTTITGATTESGAFSAGEELSSASAPGLKSETTITAVEKEGEAESFKLTLSEPAETEETASLVGHQAFALQSGNEISGVAVDNSCALHKPHPLTGGTCEASDPSAADVYVADAGHNVVDKFSPAGAYLGQITGVPGNGPFAGPFTELGGGVAVDQTGTLWVYSTHGVIDGFSDQQPNEFVPPQAIIFSSDIPTPGFAVGSEGEFFVGFEPAAPFAVGKLSHTGVRISEEVGGEEARGVATDLSSGDTYLGNFATVSRLGSDGTLVERLSQPEMSVTGLGVSSVGETVYVSDAHGNVVDVFAPEPPAPPSVEGESVTEVTSATAVLHAELNPRGADTTYQFEYGICASETSCKASGYEPAVPVPAPSIGSGFTITPVSLYAEGLTPHRAYHFRVRAVNAEGPAVLGEERVFVTQPPGGALVLPEDAAWEMVSPPDKHGALIQALEPEGSEPEGFQNLSQASVSGDAVSYPATGPTESSPAGYSNDVQVLSTHGKSGWSSRDLAVGHVAETGPSTDGFESRAFSPDLSVSVLQPFGPFVPASSSLALAPGEASEQTAFLQTDFNTGDPGSPCVAPMHCYRPLVTGAPGFSNVPPETVFGVSNNRGSCPPGLSCGPQFEGANADLSAIVLTSLVPLAAAPVEGNGLYEWQDGHLHPVSVLPTEEGGGPAEQPTLGFGTTGGFLTFNARGAVSSDGSRVFWGTAQGLYVRDTATEKTLRLDVPEPGASGGTQAPEFQLATVDGSRVFFTDAESLTMGAGSGDLYECAVVEEAGKLACHLSDVTPPTGGEPAKVQGSVLGASDDGSWVYFVADGSQEGTAGTVKGTCGSAGRGAGAFCNLYVRHAGVTRLVAVVSEEDTRDWENHELGPTRVSPNGEWLAFMSSQKITGYDNRPERPSDCKRSLDRQEGHCSEVFLYDAATRHVTCVSCNPSGARPEGQAKIPAWTRYSVDETQYQSKLLSNDGRVIFDSSDEVTPQHVTRNQDVFEYQPAGVGDCSTESLSFNEAQGGCVGLVSSGHAPGESSYVDSSATDEDIFFLTSGKLAPQDVDTAPDVYDAHVCPAGSSCVPPASSVPPPCTTADSCRAAPSPQPEGFGAPASATFNGAGNVTPAAPPPTIIKKTAAQLKAEQLTKALRTCRTRYAHRKNARTSCEASARKRFGRVVKRKSKSKAHKGGTKS
jgi:hypothetical protein